MQNQEFLNLVKLREEHIKRYPSFNKINNEAQGFQYILNDIKNRGLNAPKILELGTKRSNPNAATHKKDFFKGQGVDVTNYILSDFQEGIDVEVLADIHKLDEVFSEESFDYIILCSVLEHVKYPNLAAVKLLKCLKQDGVIFIDVPQTYPLHGYPSDYYRFSREALESCFNPKMGCKVITSYFSGQAVIIPHSPVSGWNHVGEAYLNASILIRKTNTTPKDFIYDI
jgi:SAM-dependent methyltransferase